MPPTRLGPHDLLEYNARHGVLICRECQYAIQKNALQSHLLRHKIYRDERQRLLSSINQLELHEPQDVPLPTPSSPPIDTLPIISGYRCTRCKNLCASIKRMKRHWSEAHGLAETANTLSFTRPVKLQTFFRGTKLRYFEVTPLAAGTVGAAPLIIAHEDEHEQDVMEMSEEEEQDEKMLDVPVLTPRPAIPRMTVHPSPPIDINFETLTYLHQFTTKTSHTLPNVGVGPSLQYWQTDVVVQALRRRWLTCGVLAISIYHLAILTDNKIMGASYRERAVQFSAEFSIGWEEMSARGSGIQFDGVEEEAKVTGDRIRCVLRCAQWALTRYMSIEPATSSLLQSIVSTIRGLVVTDFWHYSGDDGNEQRGSFVQAGRILKTAPCNPNPTHTVLLNLLGSLPMRMADPLGRPSGMQEVLATLSAIASLIECCGASFASDNPGSAWRSMAIWLTRITDNFHSMISMHKPAALVVLAHWAVLVERSERCGCWFLKGAAAAIRNEIAERLLTETAVIQGLVAGLEHI